MVQKPIIDNQRLDIDPLPFPDNYLSWLLSGFCQCNRP